MSRSAPHALDANTAAALAEARLADPFAVLGLHAGDNGYVLRVFVPGAQQVGALAEDGSQLAELVASQPDGLFVAELPRPQRYRLRIRWPDAVQETEDPYAFGLLLGELDLHLFAEGRHRQLGRVFGAHCMRIDGVDGVRFAVWAPDRKSVV